MSFTVHVRNLFNRCAETVTFETETETRVYKDVSISAVIAFAVSSYRRREELPLTSLHHWNGKGDFEEQRY